MMLDKQAAGWDFRVMSEELPQKFTSEAGRVLSLAGMEAERLNHHFIGTEHLLLGLLALGHGKAYNLLQRAGVELEAVCVGIEKRVGTGLNPHPGANLPYTPRVKKALSLASSEAENLDPLHSEVDTDHILLGLVQEGEGIAAQVLRDFHVNQDLLRWEVEHDRAV